MNTGKQRIPLLVTYFLTISLLLLAVMGGSRAVTVISESMPIARACCIVIDPGHGGEDGGAISCTGKPESAYNLEVSLRLRDLLHLLGYQTKMIRTRDISVYTEGKSLSQKKISDLKERVRRIADTENALVLSIHQNNFPDERYSGAQVFYAASGDSETLAKALQTNLREILNPGGHRQAKKSDGVYLMEHIGCTGVLIECGFLSNPEEEAKLRSEDYQKKLASVIAATVAEYVS